MTRRRNRSNSAAGLFAWTPEGDVQPTEIVDNPRLRPCPACHAPAGQRCRTRTSRATPMADYHPARRDTPQETP